jgi:hypothetical protein
MKVWKIWTRPKPPINCAARHDPAQIQSRSRARPGPNLPPHSENHCGCSSSARRTGLDAVLPRLIYFPVLCVLSVLFKIPVLGVRGNISDLNFAQCQSQLIALQVLNAILVPKSLPFVVNHQSYQLKSLTNRQHYASMVSMRERSVRPMAGQAGNPGLPRRSSSEGGANPRQTTPPSPPLRPPAVCDDPPSATTHRVRRTTVCDRPPCA